MKPAWDQLGDEYASSSSVVIADVDCTVEQDLCGKYDVKGYPTIKYFTAETDPKGADFQGGRDYDGLKKFVVDTLEVKWCAHLGRACALDAAHARTRAHAPRWLRAAAQSARLRHATRTLVAGRCFVTRCPVDVARAHAARAPSRSPAVRAPSPVRPRPRPHRFPRLLRCWQLV
jgi:thioredoxin-like negative regulator of GroEL